MAFRSVARCQGISNAKSVLTKSLHTSGQLASDGEQKKPPASNNKCDSGLCSKAQMEMKQLLNRKELEYIQPSRAKVTVAQFVIARPYVDKYVNPELAESCERKKQCDEMKKGGGKGKKA